MHGGVKVYMIWGFGGISFVYGVWNLFVTIRFLGYQLFVFVCDLGFGGS